MEHFPEIETKETPPKLLCKVILMRHEKTDYTDIGSGLTDNGVRDALETGETITLLSFNYPPQTQ